MDVSSTCRETNMSYDDDKPFSFPSPDEFTHYRHNDRKFTTVRVDRYDFPFRDVLYEPKFIRYIPNRTHFFDRPIHDLRFKINLGDNKLVFLKRLNLRRMLASRYTVGKHRTLPFD